MKRCAACVALLLAAVGAAAGPPDTDADDVKAQRARIAHDEAEAESLYRAREAECRGRFIVTSCVDKARAERRQALQRLADERASLDDVQRRERAEERLRGIEEKQRAAAARDGAASAADAKAASVPATHGSHAAGTPRSAAPRPAPNASAVAAEKAAEAAERAAARRQREAEAAKHRAEIEARNAQRKPGAAPLPVPPVASAASR